MCLPIRISVMQMSGQPLVSESVLSIPVGNAWAVFAKFRFDKFFTYIRACNHGGWSEGEDWLSKASLV